MHLLHSMTFWCVLLLVFNDEFAVVYAGASNEEEYFIPLTDLDGRVEGKTILLSGGNISLASLILLSLTVNLINQL